MLTMRDWSLEMRPQRLPRPLPPEYLMVFELIWSPQDASDSLTEEELLTEYSDLLPL